MSVRSYLIDAFTSLGAGVNKRGASDSQENIEGVIGAKMPELSLDMNDEDLVGLSNTWEKDWKESNVYQKFKAAGEENEKYWKGDHYERPQVEQSRPMTDNAIFEGLETYLPQVTRRDPEPMVSLAVGEDQSQPNTDFAHALQLELAEIAEDVKLRLKLKGTARNWSISLLGAVKMSWDVEENRPSVKVVRPLKLILDKDATVDEDNYTGDRLGEYRELSADKLIAFVQKNGGTEETVSFIKTKIVEGDLATKLGFIEWWTPDYMFWKMDHLVLFKKKNPHWNYDEALPESADLASTEAAPENEQPFSSTAENGQPIQAEPAPETPPEAAPGLPQGAPALPEMPEAQPAAPPAPRKGMNHFKKRRMPYILLSIYNLGKQPVDITSLMGQNLSNQDMVNKRNRQIDKFADSSNNGMVVSLERSGLTKDQASRVTSAIRNGGVIAIPTGAPQEAIYKPPPGELPVYIYNQLVDVRNRIRDIWGTRGSSPAGLESDTTVRGKIISKGTDTDRIGGGISEFLEQLSAEIYNWMVQLLYVYDDRFVENLAKGTPVPRVKVVVKQGSLLPKDATTLANQATTLASEGKMSLLDLYKALDYPNPEQMAANAWLEVNSPETLYADDPRVAKVIQARQQAASAAAQEPPKAPSMSISYKDVPPDAGAQMLAKVGIQAHPEALAAHAIAQKPSDPLAAVPIQPANQPPA